VRLVLAALVVVATPIAHGETRDAPRDLCAQGTRHHGAAIDLDVKGADIQDVFRLIADAGRVNVVVPDDVAGKVTLRLRHVAWDAVACAVAKLHHLAITVDGNILIVMRVAR
jgi:type II secretory pathway component HofQ